MVAAVGALALAGCTSSSRPETTAGTTAPKTEAVTSVPRPAVTATTSAVPPGDELPLEPLPLLVYRYVETWGSGHMTMIIVEADGRFRLYFVGKGFGRSATGIAGVVPLHAGVVDAQLLERLEGAMQTTNLDELRAALDSEACGIWDGDAESIELSDGSSKWQFAACEVFRAEAEVYATAVEVARAAWESQPEWRGPPPTWALAKAAKLIDAGGALVSARVATIGPPLTLRVEDPIVTSTGASSAEITLSAELLDSATAGEHAHLDGLDAGDAVWLVLDSDATPQLVGFIGEDAQLVDTGPSNSPFSLGHAAHLGAAVRIDLEGRIQCRADPAFSSPSEHQLAPDDALAQYLMNAQIEAERRAMREAARDERRTGPKPPAFRLGIRGGETGKTVYVALDAAGSYLGWFTGMGESRHEGILNGFRPAVGSALEVWQLDFEQYGTCGRAGEGWLLARAATQFGSFVAEVPYDQLDTLALVDLDSGEVLAWRDR